MGNEITKYKEALRKASNKIMELDGKLRMATREADIAVIGYDCRFPAGANNPALFWERLRDGFDAVREIGSDRFDTSQYYDQEKGKIGKTNTRHASLLDTDVRLFDNQHFEISPAEAVSIDPQQRLLLEISWNALENAGLDINKLKGSKTGVFIGLDAAEYFKTEVYSGEVEDITPYSIIGVSSHSAAGRVSYYFDFKGPSIVCNTACSSSLVALNTAMDSLKKRQCDLALVGGVNLLFSHNSFVGLSQFQALSGDGRCKTFDASADGFGRGEGCGVVVLKRLEDAQRDANDIEAVVRSACIGHDGRSNGFYAPNGLAEQRVMTEALRLSGASPDDVDYIEAHGTGTPLGDPVETFAISQAYKGKKKPMYIGSVKSNMGHLEAAAGMAGLIKILLSLKHRQLPPSIHFQNPNPNIDFNKLTVVTELTPWEKTSGKRMAGLNAFGISGTVAHVLLEEYTREETEKVDIPWHVLTLSAKNEEGLRRSIEDFGRCIEDKNVSIADATFASNMLKSYCQSRLALVGENKEDFLRQLKRVRENREAFDYNYRHIQEKNGKICFLFTGQGSIYKNIAKDFYELSPVFAKAIKKCESAFKEWLGISVIEAMYVDSDHDLSDPGYSQPVIFSVEYALMKLWETTGVKADVVVGHSVGEFAAACYAGLVSFDDAVKMIAYRVQLLHKDAPAGKMVGILAERAVVEKAIEDSGCRTVAIAALNGPANMTISGNCDEVDAVIARLRKSARVFTNDLRIMHPFHNKLLKPFEKAYQDMLGEIKFHEPTVDIISSVTGEIGTLDTMGNAGYWAAHMSEPVQFVKAAEKARELGCGIFVELGGAATLCGLCEQILKDGTVVFIPSLREGIAPFQQFSFAIRDLYLRGIAIDWARVYASYSKKRMALPGYPFQGKVFWKETENTAKQTVDDNEKRGKRMSIATTAQDNRLSSIIFDLKNTVQMITGTDIKGLDDDAEVLALGFDSLMFMALSKQIVKKYGVDIPLNIFFVSLKRLSDIANYILEHASMPEEQPYGVSESGGQVEVVEYHVPPAVEIQAGGMQMDMLRGLFENQFSLMRAQNEIFMNLAKVGQSAVPANASAGRNGNAASGVGGKPESAKKRDYYVPYQKLDLSQTFELDKLQQAYLKKIEERYTHAFKASKERSQRSRRANANARNTAGFRMDYKEMLYQLVAENASGSKFRDVDGNEMIDITMGFGVNLFGHSPQFVRDALVEEVGKGLPMGPMGRLTGEVARRISALTGVERVFFCNSGTEADMFAMRMARAVTGRKKIVAFTGAYHGTYDGVLALPAFLDDGTVYSIPQVPGVTENAVKDFILLTYDTEHALKYIAEHANEIAGVLVEPVQSRRPDLQPREFLQKLRAITAEKKIALIFDEVITGFRIAPGGAQEHFGIQADMVTYGKVVGGGMPIGVVSGKAEFLDSVDGGIWNYGDNSAPQVNENRTLAVGTFCNHPMAMAAANAVLKHIEAHKEEIYPALNDMTDRFAKRANQIFEKEKAPFRMIRFGSLFRIINVGKEQEVFYYGLIEKGVYIWEGRNCFLSTAHSQQDVDAIIQAIAETVKEMREAGFFGPTDFPEPTAKSGVVKWDAGIPLSLIQERLYSQILISEEDPFDLVASYFVDEIDTEQLEAHVNTIIGRHESLRTALVLENGELSQKVMDHWDFHIKKIAQEEEIDTNELIAGAISKFELSKAPMVEIILIRLAYCNKKLLVFHFHHTTADGVSMNIFVQELLSLYSGTALEEVPQYKEYVAWEEDYLQSGQIGKDRTYWMEQLEGISPNVELPYDHPQYLSRKYIGETVTSLIGPKELVALKKIAAENSSSLFTLLLSAVNILLHQLTGKNELVVATPVSNRHAGRFENCIGMFTNTVALASRLPDNTPFNMYLQQVRDMFLSSFDHHNYPLNMLVEDLGASRANPFNIVFVYENTNARNLEKSELSLEKYEYTPTKQEFDLTFEFLEENNELGVFLRYRADLFAKESMELLNGRLLMVLNQIITTPAKTASQIEIVSDKEKHDICNVFNKLWGECRQTTVAQMLEEQAERTPDNVAVVYEAEELTYRELNEKANALAHKLRTIGVKPDDFVGLIAERSIEMIVGICGIIKAGGAYVPIDPTYPKDRIRYVLDDCCPKALLTYRTTVETRIPVLDLEDPEVWEGVRKNPENVNQPEDLIYCIYTSGTTGKPKGSIIENKSVIRLVKDPNYIRLDEKTVILQTGSISFDASTFEVWGALLNGGKLVLTDSEVITDTIGFEAALKKYGVNTMWMTSTLFNQMIQANEALFDSLEYLLIGGEKLSDSHVRILKNRDNKVVLINGYGPTENTTFATTYEIPANFETIPIGRPISNTKVFIMRGDALCGVGMPGELCITGDGLSRGYLNLPEQTVEKFVDNPYGAGKLYRTGDLARWLPDGNIEYLGRSDEQVKIRGFRVELGEIESAIRAIKGIEDCAVIAREDASGDKGIYAYLLSESEIDIRKTRETLRKTMPEYMMPAYMAQIEKMPITRNGKLDKMALPAIEAKTEKEYMAPRTETEKKICGLFEEILGVKKIGVRDSFFDLGGHSLKATRLVNQIEAETGVRIAMKEIFATPTAESLALLAAGAGEYTLAPRAEEKECCAIPLAEEQDGYPMSSAQKRMFLIWQLNPEETSYNMFSAYKLNGVADAQKIRKALTEITNRHEILRTDFLVRNGELIQQIRQEAEIDFTCFEEFEKSDEELQNDFVRPFVLQNAPLLRAGLVKRMDGWMLMFDMHHIVGDGTSVGIILQEFMDIYNGREVAPLNRQYKDYSQWMREKSLSDQKEYWMKEFEHGVPVLDIPTDFPRPLIQSFEGANVVCTLDAELSRRIRELAQKHEATEYMVFLSSAMVLLSKYSRQEEIVVGSPVSARINQDMDQMLGMFVNTLALRGKLEREKSFCIFLQEMRKKCIDAFDNQMYPFEELIEAVGIRRDMSRNPLFDVMLAFQNQEKSCFALEGAEAIECSMEAPTAKFDLTFNICPNGDGYRVDLDYCAALFEREGMRSMLEHYVEILKQVVQDENIRMADVQVITEGERHKILDEFNTAETDYPMDATVIELFEGQVARTPEQAAVIYDDIVMTYGELNAKANAVGSKLITMGVRPNDYVVIQASRSLDAIIGIYGILKAGATYVPIDPEYPAERVRHILGECKPRAVIASSTWPGCEYPVVLSLEDLADVEGQSKSPNRGVRPQDMAYVIYTSGSTGAPKGAKISHRNILSLVISPDFVELNEKSRILQTGAISFDASTFEIHGALLNGGTVIMPPKETLIDTAKLKGYILAHEVNIVFITTALFNQHVENDIAVFDGLDYLFTGGEKAAEKYIALQWNRGTVGHFSNIYGPTETTTFATYYPVVEERARTPIGKPLANKGVYILDGERLCGIGVMGELCVTGDGVASGYVNNAKLTYEKFVPNPFGDGMMYRTGDLARWLPDGNIDFLGRIDEQVKIRGFRIELNDIESVIRSREDIRDVAVVVRNDASGDKALHAYLVSDLPVDSGEIKEWLRSVLPEYMIPAHMCQLEALPVNRNGKVDKKALPEIKDVSGATHVPPVTLEEKALCRVFQEILGVEQIGSKDNFLENGGDSIKAIRVVSKLREHGFEVAFKDIMLEKTVECIAAKLVSHETEENEPQVVSGRVLNTPILEDFVALNLKKPHHFNQAILYRLEDWEEELAPTAFAVLAEHHDMLRAVYRDGQLEILDADQNCGYDYISYDFTGIEDVVKKIEQACTQIQAGIDLARGPLCRLASFRSDAGVFLMICVHHLVVDGVSWRIILEDFDTALTQLRQGESVVLPPKTTSFQEWAKCISAYQNSKQMDKEKNYWQSVVHALEPLATKRDEMPAQMETVKMVLSREDTKGLLTNANRAYNTETQDLLLGALGMSVKGLTGQDKVTVGMEGHGRENIGNNVRADRTVGWFTSVYPVTIDCREDVGDSIVSAKERLKAVPNNGFGFGLVKGREAMGNCNLYFNYLGQMDEGTGGRHVAGYSTGPESAHENVSMFNGISVNGIILEGELQLTFSSDAGDSGKQELKKLAALYRRNLQKIIAFCTRSKKITLTKSDIASSEVDEAEFSEILELFTERVSK